MRQKNITYSVRKVEHEFELPKIKPRFPKMPELYLELLINKKKVNPILASEKYIHNYALDVVSSEDSFKPVSSVTNKKSAQRSNERGTFNWESSASIEPYYKHEPITARMSSPPMESSPERTRSVERANRYRKVKKSIVSSYYKKLEPAKERNDKNPESQKREFTKRRPETPHVERLKDPPPVEQITKTFGDNRPNVHQFENYEFSKDEDDRKRELLFKFNRLKKTYPKVDIPEFNMMSNHENMKHTYESTMKNLAIDSSVETYKSYLMMGFMVCELVLGRVGFDMEGYTQQQTLWMNKYEKMLIELGEKSYVPASLSKLPVEVRLIGLVIFQTTIFVSSKIIAKKTNFNLLQVYNTVTGTYEPPINQAASSSGFASGGSSPIVFIPKKRTQSVPDALDKSNSFRIGSESRMKGPSVSSRD